MILNLKDYAFSQKKIFYTTSIVIEQSYQILKSYLNLNI